MQTKIKHIMTYIFLVGVIFSCTFIFGCDNGSNDHTHEFIDGKCECGATEGIQNLTYEQAQNIYNSFESTIQSTVYVGNKLNLPKVVKDVSIDYAVDQKKYFNDEFEVIMAESFAHRTVNLDIAIAGHHFTKKITVHQELTSYFKKVADYLNGVMPSGIHNGDISLLTSYPGDKEIQIEYVSSNTAFLTHDGKRIDHEYDESVSMQLKLTKNNQSYSETYEFISMGISYADRYDKWTTYINDFFKNTKLEEGTKLPTELPLYGGRIRWIAEDPTLIYDYTTLHLPKEAKSTHLMAEVRFGSTEYHWELYDVNLDARPSDISDIDYILTFLETVTKTTEDYLVLYDGSLADINSDLLIDHEANPVTYRKFTSTKRPDIPQEKLDKLLYEGYVMPNDDNVLWIVVHETGMSYAGRDALLLANLQYNQAYRDDGRDASWCYTVDEHSIYQSFPDTYILWHATDGSNPGTGNGNGIGIEMCVNSDGNYEVSMKNNARLMAGLLNKYGLGMMNMKQHSDFYEAKSCPEIIIKTYRWYEYLTLVAREYISQTILANHEITYSVNLTEMGTKGIYDCTSLDDGQNVQIQVTIDGTTYTLDTVIKK